jgi:hypothetical protein
MAFFQDRKRLEAPGRRPEPTAIGRIEGAAPHGRFIVFVNRFNRPWER